THVLATVPVSPVPATAPVLEPDRDRDGPLLLLETERPAVPTRPRVSAHDHHRTGLRGLFARLFRHRSRRGGGLLARSGPPASLPDGRPPPRYRQADIRGRQPDQERPPAAERQD